MAQTHRRSWLALALVSVGALSCSEPATIILPPSASEPANITLSPATLTFASLADTQSVSATVFDQNGTQMTATVTWTSSNPSVVTVSPAGLVTAIGSGAGTITATAGTATAVAGATVQQVASQVVVTGAPAPLSSIGDTTRLTADVQDAGGTTIPAAPVSWASADTSVVQVDAVGGLLTAVGAGSTTVEATSGAVTGSTAVSVQQIVTSVALPSDSLQLLTGDTVRLAPSALDFGGTPVANPPVAWSSATAAAATVSAAGTVTAVAAGTTLIVATVSQTGQVDLADSTLVTVYDSLSITTASLPSGAQGSPYGPVALSATGGDGVYTWSLEPGSNPLPSGLGLAADGTLSGTPTASGSSSFTVQVASGDGQTTQVGLSIDITAQPTQLVLTQQPSGVATSGVAFAQQPTVQLQDGSGTDVPLAGVQVAAAVSSGAGVVSGTTTAQTDSTGLATFVGLAITGVGSHEIDFTSSGLTSATSSAIIVSAAPPMALTDGVPVNGLAAATGTQLLYSFTVPAGAPQIEFFMTGGTGDADLYVREGSLPTLAVYDCRPFLSTNDEICAFANPAQGDWFILIDAAATFGGVSLTASVTAACTLNTPTDTDGDRLPDCVETNTGTFVDSLNTGTDPLMMDTDGDAISDGDEVRGTLDGLDLPAFGVSPVMPTILIEHDWFDDSGHSHRPTATQVGMVTASFAAQGVQVIHDYGQGPAPFTGGNFIADPDGNVDRLGSEFYAYKAANFDANRDGYFHYNLMPHQYDFGNSSGVAELFGDDLITATLNFRNDDLAVAGTLQHELGHNLGLRHGGNVNTNRKPNYNSVMNYNYQFGGVDDDCTPISNGVLDYSSGTNASLDENNLDENVGICGGVPWDWNQNAVTTDVGVVADINMRWSPIGTPDGVFEVLNDDNDWANIYYAGINDSDGAGYSRHAPHHELIDCPEPPEHLRGHPYQGFDFRDLDRRER